MASGTNADPRTRTVIFVGCRLNPTAWERHPTVQVAPPNSPGSCTQQAGGLNPTGKPGTTRGIRGAERLAETYPMVKVVAPSLYLEPTWAKRLFSAVRDGHKNVGRASAEVVQFADSEPEPFEEGLPRCWPRRKVNRSADERAPTR